MPASRISVFFAFVLALMVSLWSIASRADSVYSSTSAAPANPYVFYICDEFLAQNQNPLGMTRSLSSTDFPNTNCATDTYNGRCLAGVLSYLTTSSDTQYLNAQSSLTTKRGMFVHTMKYGAQWIAKANAIGAGSTRNQIVLGIVTGAPFVDANLDGAFFLLDTSAHASQWLACTASNAATSCTATGADFTVWHELKFTQDDSRVLHFFVDGIEVRTVANLALANDPATLRLAVQETGTGTFTNSYDSQCLFLLK